LVPYGTEALREHFSFSNRFSGTYFKLKERFGAAFDDLRFWTGFTNVPDESFEA
jgi:hypothetical protein